MLLRQRGNLREGAVDVFLRILLQPCTLAVLVAYVDNVPMVGNLPSAGYAAVPCDNVTTKDYERRLGGGACRIKCLLPPFPPLLNDVGVLGVLISIEVINEQHIGAYGLVTGATRRLSGTDSPECNPLLGNELVLGPRPYGLLSAIIGNDTPVGFEVSPVRRQ